MKRAEQRYCLLKMVAGLFSEFFGAFQGFIGSLL